MPKLPIPFKLAIVTFVASFLLIATPVKGADYYWTASGSGDGGTASGGTGTWNTSSSLWRSGSSTGALATYVSSGSNNAYFTGTPGTVTLGANLTVGTVGLFSTGYTIAQGAGTTLTASTINSIGVNTMGAILSGTSGLTKAGSGTVVLSGSSTLTGGINIRSGGLTVDMTQGGWVASQALTLGNNNDAGGVFTLKGSGTSSSALSLGSVTFGGDYLSKIVADGAALTIGDITRGSGSQMMVDISSAGTVKSSSMKWNSSVQSANTFISQYFGVKTDASHGDFAVFDSNGYVTRLNASTALPTSGGSSTGDYLISSGTVTLTGSTQARTIRFNTDSGNLGLNVGNSLLSGTVANLNFVVEGAGNVTISGQDASKKLNASSTAGSVQANFWTFGTGVTTVSLDMNNSGQMIKMGPGLLVISANQTTGQGNGYRIMEGVVRQAAGTPPFSVKVNSGGVFEIGSDLDTSNATYDFDTTNFVFGTTTNGGTQGGGGGDGGLSAYDSTATGNNIKTRVVSLTGSNATTLTWVSSLNQFLGDGAALILGSTYSNATLKLVNAINLNTTVANPVREIRVNNGIYSNDVDGELSGVISNTGANAAGGLLKTGAGTLALSGSNTYTGLTFISAGQLNLGNGGTSGSVAGNILNNGILGFNRTDAYSYSGVISGTGSVTVLGSGTIALTGANSYTGSTTISAGQLNIGNGGTSGNVAGNIVNNGSLGFNRTDAYTYSGVISGTGAVTLLGSGTTTLSAASTYTGATTIKAGALVVSGSLSGSAVTVGDVSNPLTSAVLRGGNGLTSNTASISSLSGVTSGAVIDPGLSANTAGVLNSNSLSLSGSAHLAIQIGGSTAGGNTTSGYDRINLLGATASTDFSGGVLDLTDITSGSTLPTDALLFIVVNNGTGAPVTPFSSVTLGGTTVADTSNIVIGGQQFSLVYNANYDGVTGTYGGVADGSGNDVALMAVPEPQTWAMLIGGLGLLIKVQNLRKRRVGTR